MGQEKEAAQVAFEESQAKGKEKGKGKFSFGKGKGKFDKGKGKFGKGYDFGKDKHAYGFEFAKDSWAEFGKGYNGKDEKGKGKYYDPWAEFGSNYSESNEPGYDAEDPQLAPMGEDGFEEQFEDGDADGYYVGEGQDAPPA